MFHLLSFSTQRKASAQQDWFPNGLRQGFIFLTSSRKLGPHTREHGTTFLFGVKSHTWPHNGMCEVLWCFHVEDLSKEKSVASSDTSVTSSPPFISLLRRYPLLYAPQNITSIHRPADKAVHRCIGFPTQSDKIMILEILDVHLPIVCKLFAFDQLKKHFSEPSG